MKIKDFRFGNGSITFQSKIDPSPETRDTTGNVTIVNQATEGSPAHFEVSFMLNSVFEQDGLEAVNVFHWNCVVPEADHRARYRSVEDKAARLIAPMLRSLADKIESGLKDFGDSPSNETPS